MDLILNIDAVDKTAAAVVSASDRTPVDPLTTLVLGDVETLTVQFCDDDGATPAFASDATYGLAVGLGQVTANGEQIWTSTKTFTLVGSTRTGYLSLDTANLRSAVYNGLLAGGPNRSGVNFTLHVRVTDANGYAVTYGLLPVFVAARVLPSPAPDFEIESPVTNNAVVLFDGTSGQVLKNSTMTYSGTTLTVPDGWGITSAGSIALTAGGTNKNITLTPTGTGAVVVNFNDSPDTAAKLVVGADGAAAMIVDVSYGGNANFRSFAVGGTRAAPSNTGSGVIIGGVTGGGYFNGSLSSSSKAYVNLGTDQAWTDATTGTRISFGVTPNESTTAFVPMQLRNTGVLELGLVSKATPAWGSNGTHLQVKGNTITDISSSGTVATAVASAFAAPTFAASSATTFTDAANLYIAGAPAAGANVTLTRTHALWIDDGSFRLDGTTGAGVAAGTLANAPSAGDPDKWIPINSDGTQYWIPAWTA